MSSEVTLSELWRYPVKSMGGESLQSAEVGARGITGDRLWALRDESVGVITNAKKLPALLSCTARYLEEPPSDVSAGSSPPVAIRLPNGDELRSDRSDVHERLSRFVGKEVRLHALRPASDREHYKAQKATAEDLRSAFALEPGEPWPDMSMFPVSLIAKLARFATPPGTYFDAYPLHILSTGSLASLQASAPDVDFSVERFRPNILLDAGAGDSAFETTCFGGALSVGSALLRVEIPTVRCSMIMRAQPGLEEDPRVLRAAVAVGRCVGAYGPAARAGRIEVGQTIASVSMPEETRLGSWMKGLRSAVKRNVIRAAMPRE